MDYDELARMALAFVLEAETFPVFVEWVKTHHVSQLANEWSFNNPDVKAVRQLWADNSNDPVIRNLKIL
jgi:hypothetical protein